MNYYWLSIGLFSASSPELGFDSTFDFSNFAFSFLVMLFIMELFMERLMISATSTAAGMKAITIPIALFGIYIAEVFSLRNSTPISGSKTEQLTNECFGIVWLHVLSLGDTVLCEISLFASTLRHNYIESNYQYG